MTYTYQFQAFEPFPPKITTLGATDTICLPSIKEGWYYFVDGIVISNLASATRTLDLHLRLSTASPTSATQICNDMSIDANKTYQLPIGPLTVPSGYVISGLASVAASVNIILTGHYRVMPPPESRM